MSTPFSGEEIEKTSTPLTSKHNSTQSAEKVMKDGKHASLLGAY